MPYSITSFKSLDIHIGSFVQDAYKNVSHDDQPDGFIRFLEREEKERIYRGRFDSPRSLLAAIRHDQKQELEKHHSTSPADGGEVMKIIQRYNHAKLPAIGYYRELNYGISTNEACRSTSHDFLASGLRGGAAYFAVDYRIVFMAYDVDSLDAMVLAFILRFHIASNMEKEPEFFPERKICRHTPRGIELDVTIDGQSLPLTASFEDPKDIGATHVPGEHEDGRIYAAECTLTINMPVIAGMAVDVPKPDVRVCMQPMAVHPTAWADRLNIPPPPPLNVMKTGL